MKVGDLIRLRAVLYNYQRDGDLARQLGVITKTVSTRLDGDDFACVLFTTGVRRDFYFYELELVDESR